MNITGKGQISVCSMSMGAPEQTLFYFVGVEIHVVGYALRIA